MDGDQQVVRCRGVEQYVVIQVDMKDVLESITQFNDRQTVETEVATESAPHISVDVLVGFESCINA